MFIHYPGTIKRQVCFLLDISMLDWNERRAKNNYFPAYVGFLKVLVACLKIGFSPVSHLASILSFSNLKNKLLQILYNATNANQCGFF